MVEDESLMRWSLRECLEQAGYEVLAAETGDEALDRWRSGVDLVLLDWKLPQADGLTVLRRIKKDRPNCPVIMMTAYGAEELDRRTRTLGVHAVVDKPFDLGGMMRLVEEALAGAAS